MNYARNPEVSRFLRFAAVGAFGAVIDFTIFNLLSNSNTLAMRANVAQAISFVCAVVSNFILNRYWTYPDSRSKPVTRQVVQFIVVSLVGLGIRTPLFTFLEKILIGFFDNFLSGNRFLTPMFVGHNLALAIGILVVMFWNFLANRYWTYNDVETSSGMMSPQK